MEQENKEINFLIRDFMGERWYPPSNWVTSPIYMFDQSWDWSIPVWRKLLDMGRSKIFIYDEDYKLLMAQAEHELVTGNLIEFVAKLALIIEYCKSLT